MNSVAKAIDKNSPLNVAVAGISVGATIVAASVVRAAANYGACRKTANKTWTKSATIMSMPMLSAGCACGYERRSCNSQSHDRCQTDLLQMCSHIKCPYLITLHEQLLVPLNVPNS